jgi:hypothetical protein
MILLGKNITQANDILIEVGIENIYKGLKNSNGEVAKLQEKLRIIRSIDSNQYRRLKTSLPYIVCANFNPKLRKKENFVFTERFIVDIDHLSDYDIDIQDLKSHLKSDNRVELLFESPSGDGLKVMFKNATKITDSSYYSMFYKTFCIRFSEANNLGSAVDVKTCDVSRCCFVSYDPDAYYNSNVVPVNCQEYVDENSLKEFDNLNIEFKTIVQINKQKDIENDVQINKNEQGLSVEIINAIKQKMGLKIKVTSEKIYEQPEQLKEKLPSIIEIIESVGLVIKSNKPISYGRQLVVTTQNQWAEINLFYGGKKGISVVPTTKTGSNQNLCKVVVELLKNCLDSF